MLKKINSILSQSSLTPTTTAASKKQGPQIIFSDGKRSSDSAASSAGLLEPVRPSNTVKIYVSYDIGMCSISSTHLIKHSTSTDAVLVFKYS